MIGRSGLFEHLSYRLDKVNRRYDDGATGTLIRLWEQNLFSLLPLIGKTFFHQTCFKCADKLVGSCLNGELTGSIGNNIQTRSFLVIVSAANLSKFLLGYRRYGKDVQRLFIFFASPL